MDKAKRQEDREEWQKLSQRMIYLQQLYPPVDSRRLLVRAEVATKTQDLHVRERLLHEFQRHLCALQFNITPFRLTLPDSEVMRI